MHFRRCFAVFFIFAFTLFVTAKGDVESTLIRIGVDAEHAVINVRYWPDTDDTRTRIIATNVEGSAFLVNSGGDFITAAHVFEHYKPNSGEGKTQREGESSSGPKRAKTGERFRQ